MNTNIVIHWDSLEYMKTLPDKCIDLVLTDPPYWIDIWKMNFTSWANWWVAKRNDYRWKANWDSSIPDIEYFDEIFRISKKQIIFWWNYFTEILPPTKSWIIWDKRVEEKYSNDFADCEMAWCSEWQARIFRFLWSWMLQWNMKHKEKREHPTMKPKELFKWCLENYSQPWDIILDCFAWSWTTAVASIELWRKYIVIEKDEDYCNIIHKRIRNTTPPLFI